MVHPFGQINCFLETVLVNTNPGANNFEKKIFYLRSCMTGTHIVT